MRVSEISLGTWAFGSGCGTVSEEDSLTAMHHAVDLGVNFLDTVDVYGDVRSETLIGRVLKDRPMDKIFVATKVPGPSNAATPGMQKEREAHEDDPYAIFYAVEAMDAAPHEDADSRTKSAGPLPCAGWPPSRPPNTARRDAVRNRGER